MAKDKVLTKKYKDIVDAIEAMQKSSVIGSRHAEDRKNINKVIAKQNEKPMENFSTFIGIISNYVQKELSASFDANIASKDRAIIQKGANVVKGLIEWCTTKGNIQSRSSGAKARQSSANPVLIKGIREKDARI